MLLPPGGARRPQPALVLLAAVVGCLVPEPAWAQGRRVVGEVSGHLGVGVSVGELAEHVGALSGGGFSAAAFFDVPLLLGVRFDATWLAYGESDFRVAVTPSVEAEVTTKNTVRALSISPLLELSSGRLRPYVQGLIGASKFATTTTISGSTVTAPADIDEWSVPLGIGAGLRLDFGVDASFSEFLPMVEIGATYVHHGRVQYMTEDRVREAFEEGLPIDPIRSDVNLVLIQLRLTLGFTY